VKSVCEMKTKVTGLTDTIVHGEIAGPDTGELEEGMDLDFT